MLCTITVQNALLKVDFFSLLHSLCNICSVKSYTSLILLIMNGHYCGHYTTNDIEGKITEC